MSNRGLTALIIVVIALAFSFLLYRTWFVAEPSPEQSGPAEAVKDEARKPRIRVVMTRCARVAGRTELEGYVENTGTVTLRFVTVQSLWKDENGLIVGTDVIYVVSNDTLEPGERRTFRDVTRLSNVRKCNARPLDWWS